MDWPTFVSSMTSALAWPVVVGGIGLGYRREIKNFLGGMKRFKLGPVEAEMFEIKAKEAKQIAMQLPEVPLSKASSTRNAAQGASTGSSPTPSAIAAYSQIEIDDRLMDLLAGSAQGGGPGAPRFALIEAWTMVEHALRQAASKRKMAEDLPISMLILEFSFRGVVSRDEAELLRKLHGLRNDAVMTSVVFKPEVALDYIVASSTILRKIAPLAS